MRLTERNLVELGLEEVIPHIGTLYEFNNRYQLVGFELMDRQRMIVMPVWKDRKLCQQIARSKY